MDLNILKRRLQFPNATPLESEEIPKIVRETEHIIETQQYHRNPPPPNSKIFTPPDDFKFNLSEGPITFVSKLGLCNPVYDFRLTTRKGKASHKNFQNLLMDIL